MALSFIKLFDPAQLTTSTATYFTLPTTPTTNILQNARIQFINTTGSPVTVTANAIKVGGSASASNEFLSAYSIAGNAYLEKDVPTLAAGDFIQALASANTSITIQPLGGVIVS